MAVGSASVPVHRTQSEHRYHPARQSIDERRSFFRQNFVARARPDQDIEEHWFPGVHSDVGGGYPEAGGALWRCSFEWMLSAAGAAGLDVDQQRVADMNARHLLSSPAWLEPQHESLTLGWWPAEYFPKKRWRSALRRRVITLGRGRRRTIPEDALLDAAALKRLLQRPTYRPPNHLAGLPHAVA